MTFSFLPVSPASRMESNGFPMCIHVSQSTMELLKSCADWLEFGTKDIKGWSWCVFGIKSVAIANILSLFCSGKGLMTTYLAKEGDWESAIKTLEVQICGTETLGLKN